MNKIKVLVADDQAVARRGLSSIVKEAEDLEFVGQAGTIHEAIDLAERLKPDVILLDGEWRGNHTAGVDAVRLIREKSHDTEIVLITVYRDLLDPAAAAGALPLEKGCSEAELLDTIRYAVVARGGPEVPQQSLPTRRERLTEREREVLKLIVEGLKDRKIALRLHITESTVKKHVGSILGKLGVDSRTGAAVIAQREHLLN